MGDMTKFNSAIEYYIFNVLLMCLLPKEFVTGTVKRIARFISSYEQVNNNICCLAVKKNRCQQ